MGSILVYTYMPDKLQLLLSTLRFLGADKVIAIVQSLGGSISNPPCKDDGYGQNDDVPNINGQEWISPPVNFGVFDVLYFVQSESVVQSLTPHRQPLEEP